MMIQMKLRITIVRHIDEQRKELGLGTLVKGIDSRTVY